MLACAAMGTDKRARQKANRNARIDQATVAASKADNQKRMVTVAVAVVAALAVIGGVFLFMNRDDETDVATGPDGSTSTTVGGDPAAGGACAPLAEPLPEGAPAFEVPTEPTNGELQITELAPGSGEPVPEGATVTVQYVGVACSTGAIFDASYTTGEPATFPLDQVIPGWTQGIPGMTVGSQRLLVIPGDLAYGQAGSPPDIGPDETLVFFVELVSFEGGAAESATPPPPGPGATLTGPTPCPPADGSAERTTSFEQAPSGCADASKTYTAVFTTNLGTIKVALDAATMTNTTSNFISLARYHYYDGTAIFRTDTSIDIFQGGSPTTNSPSDPGPGYTITDESGPFTYQPNQLIMARSAGPDSSGAQFFFSTGPKVSNLDAQGTYLLFGEVTEGQDILQQIMALHVAGGDLGGAPGEPVIIETVTIDEA